VGGIQGRPVEPRDPVVLRVSEVFYSLQGEGIHLGVPAVFIRLSGCNLRCAWCDSTYAWKVWNDTKKVSVLKMVDEVEKFPAKHVVVTGGEPLLQAGVVAHLARELKRKKIFVEVETNGTIPPAPTLTAAIDQFNVCIKIGNAKNRVETEIPDAIMAFLRNGKAYFKFVVDDPRTDMVRIRELERKYGIPVSRIILMPRTGEDVRGAERVRRMQALAEVCKRQGYRLSPRLHVELWEGVRGR